MQAYPIEETGYPVVWINGDGIGGFVVSSQGDPYGFDIDDLIFPRSVQGRLQGPSSQEQGGPDNPSEDGTTCYTAKPVNCATGDFDHSLTTSRYPAVALGWICNEPIAAPLPVPPGRSELAGVIPMACRLPRCPPVGAGGNCCQLLEAKRLAGYGDVAHGRLALLLLDNAAEVSLRRTAATTMTWAQLYNNAAIQLRDVDPEQDGLQELLDEIGARTVSRTLAKRIDRGYDALVDFVADRAPDSLPPEHAECFKIVHRYRNAAYHCNAVRADVLRPAVEILFFLCCHLLKKERQIVQELAPPPALVLEFLGDLPSEVEPSINAHSAVGLSGRFADALLADLHLDHLEIARALSDHLVGRLGQLENDLDTIGTSMRTPLSTTLRLVQQSPETPEQFAAPLAHDFWTRDLPVTEPTLTDWRERANQLAQVGDARDALRAFAAVERPIEDLEKPVARWIEDIDRAEQARLDWLRGK